MTSCRLEECSANFVGLHVLWHLCREGKIKAKSAAVIMFGSYSAGLCVQQDSLQERLWSKRQTQLSKSGPCASKLPTFHTAHFMAKTIC